MDSERLRRQDEELGRIYTGPSGEDLPSITTLCGRMFHSASAIAAWRGRVGEVEANLVLRKAVERGNRIHATLEEWLRHGGRCPYPGIERWMSSMGATSAGAEITVCSPDIGYAGTCDAYIDTPDDTIVVDWKTGAKREHHALQASAYAAASHRLADTAWVPIVQPLPKRAFVIYIDAFDVCRVYEVRDLPGSIEVVKALATTWRWEATCRPWLRGRTIK